MSDSNLFGEIFIASRIEQAAKDLVTDFYDAYIAEAERVLEKEVGYFARLAQGSVMSMSEFERRPEFASPSIIVVSPGTDGDPQRLGDGSFRTRWRLGVGVLVVVPDDASASETSKAMAAVIRSLFLQHGSLGGIAEGIDWLGESYDEASDRSERTIGEARVRFAVDIDGIVDTFGQPTPDGEPPEDPDEDPGDVPTVETTGLDINTY